MREIKSEFNQDLKIHRLQCTFCEAKFTRAGSLRRHLTQRCKTKQISTDDIDAFMQANYGKRAKEYFQIKKSWL